VPVSLILIVVILGNVLGPLYSSTANVVLPNLEASFATDVDTMEWAVTGYMLGFSIAMPVAGWLGDRFGRRSVYLFGIGMFALFSILVSVSWDSTSLIVFRILQAMAGGLVSPTGLALVNEAVPPAQRGRALGLWGMGMMLAPAFGPWLSGWVVDTYDDWRPIFLLGVPLSIVAFVLAWRVLPRTERRTLVKTPFDAVGFLALTISLSALLVPLSQGSRVGWDDGWVEGSFVLSLAAFVFFVVHELRTPWPMLDLHLFDNRTFTLAVVLRAVLAVGYYTAIYLLPLFTQTMLGWTPTLAGFALVPGGIIMALSMPVAGMLNDRYGTRPLALAGFVLLALGTYDFSHIDFGWDVGHIALVNIVRSVGLACLFTPLTSAALGTVAPARAGYASGIVNTVWQVCGSVGISLAQAFFDARTWARYSDAVGYASQSRVAVQHALEQSQTLLQHAGPMPANAALSILQIRFANAAQVLAYGDTFVVATVVVALAIPFAFMLPGGLRRRGIAERDGHGAVDVEASAAFGRGADVIGGRAEQLLHLGG
jgi:EmrB/QacA subfamily drug resistance transporter